MIGRSAGASTMKEKGTADRDEQRREPQQGGRVGSGKGQICGCVELDAEDIERSNRRHAGLVG